MTGLPDDRTVQVPVSLAKRVLNTRDVDEQVRAMNELRALLSQPTPTTEPEFRFSATTGEELPPFQAATGEVRARIAASVMPGWTSEAADAAYGAYMGEAASTPTDEPPHTPFCIRTSTPDKPCRCWKSGSTDEED